MASSKEEHLLQSVSITPTDDTLPSRFITIPSPLRNYKWGLIVATQSASWAGKFSLAQFYWDATNNQIKVVLTQPDAALAVLDQIEEFFNNLFLNESQMQAFNQAGLDLISNDNTPSNKRQRADGGEEDGDDANATSSRPANPSTMTSTASIDDSTELPITAIVTHNLTIGDDKTATMSILVRQDRVGLLIGQQGKTIRLLKRLSGATINIDQQAQQAGPNGQRELSLSGTEEQVKRAHAEIDNVLLLSQANVDMSKLPPGSTRQTITIPNDSVGAVIGKQGDTIRLLQIFSHAHVMMEKDNEAAADASVREVTLSGPPDSIKKACTAINELVEAFTNSKQSQAPFDPHMILFHEPSTCSQTIIINNNIVGHVIGTKGHNFTQIRNETRCTIQVDKNTKNPKRELVITGPTESAVTAAVGKITQIVRNAQQSVGQQGQQGQQLHQWGNNQNQGQQQWGGYQNNNRNQPSLNQPPQQMGGFGHHRPNQMGQMPGQQMGQMNQMPFGVQGMMGGNPMMGSQMMGSTMNQMMMPYPPQLQQQQPQQPQQQQQQQVPPAPIAAPAARPKPLRHVPDDKLNSFWYYFDHYKANYPEQEALQYAHHYIDNPPTSK